jgi:hypothetical protein
MAVAVAQFTVPLRCSRRRSSAAAATSLNFVILSGAKDLLFSSDATDTVLLENWIKSEPQGLKALLIGALWPD